MDATDVAIDATDSSAPHGVPTSSDFALWILVAIVITAPWPFGGVEPWATRTLTLICLVVVAAVTTHQTLRGGVVLPGVRLAPAAAVVVLVAFQLVPLPSAIHRIFAPGTFTIWYPTNAAARTVLAGSWTPVSVFPHATLESLALAGGIGLLAALGAPAARRPSVAVAASVATAAGGLAVAVYGVIARGVFGSQLYGTIAVPTVAPFGPFVSKNHFAGYVEALALLTLGLAVGLADHERGAGAPGFGWVHSPRAGRILIAAAASMAMSLAVLISLSRGGIVSLALGGAAFVVLRRIVRRRRRQSAPATAIAVTLGLLGLAVLVAILPEEAHERIRSLLGVRGEQSGSFRMEMWRDCLQAIAASPFVGHGLGAFADAFPRYKSGFGDYRVEHAESDYLELGVETGLLGMGLAAVALAVAGHAIIRELRKGADRRRRGIALGGAAAVASLLVHGLFDFNLRIPSNGLAFAFVACIAVGAATAPRTQPRGLAIGTSLTALAAMLLWLLAGPVPSPASAADETYRAAAEASDPEARRLRLDRAEPRVRQIVRSRPAEPESWLMLAWIREARGDHGGGVGLARHALSLDPRWPALQEQAARLGVTVSD